MRPPRQLERVRLGGYLVQSPARAPANDNRRARLRQGERHGAAEMSAAAGQSNPSARQIEK